MTSLVGQTINERYRLEALLGDGGMGAVYRTYDLNLDRPIALKLMHAHFARQPEFRARLIQEAKTAAQLDHPSAVRVFDFGQSGDNLFIAMEYVDGGSLRDHLRRLQRMQKFLPLAQSLQIVAQIADVLDYAHRRGIVHRDVKPGNILLKRLSRPDDPKDQPFRAMLTDFGLVKLQEGTHMTQSGTTLGTPTYMSPEQCEGGKLDGRSDLYALGVVLYELVTNHLPFNFQTLSEALAAHNRGAMPVPAHSLRADVPPLIDGILAKSLAKNPNDRYADGAEMERALRSAIAALDGSTPTQVVSREEVSILERVSDPPPGYELHIDTAGQSTTVIPLDQAVITIGRQADNRIVLPAEGISRHHARLQATALGWELMDLGGVNGTFINDRRLRVDDPTPILPGSRIRIGPYEMTLRGPETPPQPLELSQPTRLGGVTAPVEQVSPTPSVEPLGIFLPRDTITADPGERVELRVEVVNQGEVDDRVSLRVQGIPGNWVTTPDEFVTVPAGRTAQLTILIEPPRHRSTPTGRQRVRIELISQRYPTLKLATSASLLINGFVDFEASMVADQLRLPGNVTVTVQNTGSAPLEFSVVARDRQNAIRFRGEKGRIKLQPGQTANVALELEAKQRTVFGSNEIYPFEVDVVLSNGERQTLAGEAQSGTLIPGGLVPIVVFIVTFACAISVLALIYSQFDGRENGAGDVGTVTPAIPAAGLTETAVSASQTIAAATQMAATAAVQGDADGDGLSNAQEVILRTDPNNPDSDGDTLRDGDELNIYGSDPTKRDTDGDLLTDDYEVNISRTSPSKPDTDGDGVPDGAEVALGTNPLATPVVSPTPSITATPAPGITPSPTGSPTATVPPSLTPTPTASPLPSITPSVTATPSATSTSAPSATATQTATPQPTATSTATASPTASPTITLTPTNTPLPNPVLTCATVPPTIDGVFQINEWTPAPLIQFQPADNPANLVQVYILRDASRLYMAFLMNDATADNSDSLRVVFDTTNNGLDPDTADRFFQIGRDNTLVVQAGIGSNSDGQLWNSDYTSTNWSAFLSQSAGQWVVEMQIDVSAEMGSLTNPFGAMFQVLSTQSVATWPPAGNLNQPDSWQDVTDAVCN